MPPVVEVEDLRKAFGSFAAVDGVSFNVRKGECFGLLGPNGAGKTTTIRMLYGYTPASGGRLRIFGRDLGPNLRELKGRIGVCQQEDNLDPDLNVLDNLRIFARYFDLPPDGAAAEAKSLLSFFGLESRAASSIQALSGGMKRRLVLARSLINRPELLILDEPTTGLDPQSRHQVWQRLEELKGRGLTILLTTHYMEEAARLCDRLIIIDHGRVLVEGSPTDLIRDHVGREVIEVAAPEEAIRNYLREKGTAFEDLGHRLLIYRGADEGLFERLTRHHCREGCTLRLATLEDVFLRLTGRDLRE
jgi:lipooligosaccharide transport system ATP-binding protein